ncbi:high mobility group protein DSP1-like [Panonychus citri]|uniref:high mobility group protein DSP1-like n=1 Tax=Panonychus citri TaxID=50023 RepID=UPI002307D5E5|nr:high mobility group protein DSP1-like [Panonychus citri]
MGKGGDSKPKGRMSAYAYFFQNCREEGKKKHPSEPVVFAEFSRECADKWKNMDEKEKQQFQTLSDKDKKRFQTEMADYKPIDTEKNGKKRKRAKDPHAPKRALSAFFWFCNDERAKVKETMPDSSIGEVAKELGKRWGVISEKEKSKYGALAAKDKARYEKESNAYKNKKTKAPTAKGAKKDDSDDDDEIEEEEEEEESE